MAKSLLLIIVVSLIVLIATSVWSSIRILNQGNRLEIGGQGIQLTTGSTTETGTYWTTARTAYWTDTRVALWSTARNTTLP